MTSLTSLYKPQKQNIITNSIQKKVKSVFVATPTIDCRLDVHYVDSLIATIHECKKINIDVIPIFIRGESILHLSRNHLVKIFYESGADSLVFIDSDQKWEPNSFIKIVTSDKPVHGLAVPLKRDYELIFNVIFDFENQKIDKNDITVSRIGTGFLKIDRKVIKDLWDSSEDILFKGKSMKMIFDYGLSKERDFIGEDFIFCEKIKSLGYDIWISLNDISEHIGTKFFSGDIKMYYDEVKKVFDEKKTNNISLKKYNSNIKKGFI